MSSLMKNTPLIPVLALLTCSLTIGANANTPEDPVHDGAKKVMKKLDSDKSGTLSKEEASPNKRITKRFDKFDKDKDGQLSMAELSKALGGGKAKKKK